MNKEIWNYSLIRLFTYPIRFFPYSWIHRLGKWIGILAFFCMREYRKRALSNLALATDLALSEKELLRIAKQSFQNLAINCLEYPRFAKERDFSRVILCENPETADALYRQGQGIIFFCGHQSNWEALFLDGTRRMKGIAIGKSIKNKKLYQWILSIREKHGGKIIAPRSAIKEGLRALRKGVFVGIVGDQGMPDSGYAFPFLGRRAWTSTAPALLAYKTNSPVFFAATRRVAKGYRIRYSDPIWPDLAKPMEKEVKRIMDTLLGLLQESIKRSPGEWLWQHNRWKQQTPQIVYKPYRQDCICIILPQEDDKLAKIIPHLPTLKSIYPLDFLFFIAPESCRSHPLIPADEVIHYKTLQETLLLDYRFKLIYDFAEYAPIKDHYERLSAFHVLDIPELKTLARPYLHPASEENLSEVFKRALCRPGTIWRD